MTRGDHLDQIRQVLALGGEFDHLSGIDPVHRDPRFAGEAPADAAPRCASWECDRAEFVPLARARELIHPDQAAFLERLEELLRP